MITEVNEMILPEAIELAAEIAKLIAAQRARWLESNPGGDYGLIAVGGLVRAFNAEMVEEYARENGNPPTLRKQCEMLADAPPHFMRDAADLLGKRIKLYNVNGNTMVIEQPDEAS